MSPIIVLSLALQIACGVHVVRTGRPLYWLFILLFFSYIAVLIYFIAEVLPDLRNNPSARRTARRVRSQVDPDRELRQADRRLAMADTVENRRQLAEECLRSGDHARAESLFSESLRGIHRTDPDLMLGLARAQYGQGKAQDARATLDALIATNPDFRSSEGHLLYARAVEDMGDAAAAREEYAALVPGYPGEEARARYALLLGRTGEPAAARRLFEEIVHRCETAPDYYRREQREWFTLARKELAGPPAA